MLRFLTFSRTAVALACVSAFATAAQAQKKVVIVDGSNNAFVNIAEAVERGNALSGSDLYFVGGNQAAFDAALANVANGDTLVVIANGYNNGQAFLWDGNLYNDFQVIAGYTPTPGVPGAMPVSASLASLTGVTVRMCVSWSAKDPDGAGVDTSLVAKMGVATNATANGNVISGRRDVAFGRYGLTVTGGTAPQQSLAIFFLLMDAANPASWLQNRPANDLSAATNQQTAAQALIDSPSALGPGTGVTVTVDYLDVKNVRVLPPKNFSGDSSTDPASPTGAGVALYDELSAVPPAAGDLVVSEIMFNPGPLTTCNVDDANAEWFEVTNISDKVLNLNDNVFFQDGYPNASGTFFRPTETVAWLPPLYCGQRFLFCRKADPAVNSGLTNVDYDFAVNTGDPVPGDNARVSSTGMQLNNGATGERLFISVGGPLVVPGTNPNGYVTGTLVDQVGYIAGAIPFALSGNQTAAERIDLFAPMIDAAGANSANLAISTTNNVSAACTGTGDFLATPRALNSTDNTLWPTSVFQNYNSILSPNFGTLRAKGPAAIGLPLDLRLGAGPASTAFTLGYAEGAGDLPFSLFFAGNPGSIVLDIGTLAFLDDISYVFDGAGQASIGVPVPNNPLLETMNFYLQWLAFDFTTFQLVGSDGLQITICQ